jgi:hypothetical protein
LLGLTSFTVCIVQEEGVDRVEPLAPVQNRVELRETLLCFVLVAPNSAHAFCSRYDFGPWPLLPGISQLPPGATEVCDSHRKMECGCRRLRGGVHVVVCVYVYGCESVVALHVVGSPLLI